jgi:hypothetical protein
MTSSLLTGHTGAIRASDADRETALDLLREHWLAGRLTLEEYEARCEEATAACFVDQLRHAARELPCALPAPLPAPAPPAAQAKAIVSVVLGAVSLCVAWVPFLFLVALPASMTAWLLGRRVRRADRYLVRTDTRVVATVGEVLGVVATAMGVLALTACGMIIGVV